MDTSSCVLAKRRKRGEGSPCCSGFTWDSFEGRCVECRAGYFGIDCSNKCPFPSYGKHCQQECQCNAELCDVSEGCVGQTSHEVVTSHPAFNTTPKNTQGNKITNILKESKIYTAVLTSTDIANLEKDSKIVHYTVLGDIRPILYAIFSVILLFVMLSSTYIIGKKIQNSQCTKHTSVIGEGNIQDGGVYQEIDSFEQNVTYSVCRTNIEEAEDLRNGGSDAESNEEKDVGPESTNVKSAGMG
ncbi:uncharacterized protein LOC125675443 isoform X2 [Ostrea edulis]|uniref:uncharacterized protein LOC125675443 isoform X2 n=1 Tax=Ostrea edulis TaxID=37623 RepID=UPI0024AFC4B2|nr:uncharacterized protein LOC125675443 isoform X2 [Ostrea edulis]